ncbi:MAG: Na+/H+ antiporter NhaA [Phycisphaerae bacterium]|mgnify:CR=1 FL=1|nr:Na+/H+ antiporter NhaA [Phycisphaerae bacterium]
MATHHHHHDHAPRRPVDVLLRPIHRILGIQSVAGGLLLACAVVALVVANSPWAASYAAFWHTPLSIGVGTVAISMSLGHVVNDGLMAIFFFVIGLEIKREVMVGELASVSRAMGPAIAAVGGMVVPALLYLSIAGSMGGAAVTRGWAIPTATDIAFAVGIMAMLGHRVPRRLRIFVTALAIVDDLLAVIVIGVFYTSDISLVALGGAAAALAVSFGANRLGVRSPLVYLLIGIALWAMLLRSGVHATIGGVLLALTIPASIRLDPPRFIATARSAIDRYASHASGPNVMVQQDAQAAIRSLEQSCEQAQAPLVRLEHALHPWVAYAIMPIFALANAGVTLTREFTETMGSGVGYGVAAGLALGKPIGILGAVALGITLGICRLPDGVSRTQLAGGACLAGVGFTMSLFIATLSFDTPAMLQLAKIGVLTGSLVSGIAGICILVWAARGRVAARDGVME